MELSLVNEYTTGVIGGDVAKETAFSVVEAISESVLAKAWLRTSEYEKEALIEQILEAVREGVE